MFHDDLFFLSPFSPSLFINTDESMAEAALASTEIKIGRPLQKDEIYFVRLQVTVFSITTKENNRNRVHIILGFHRTADSISGGKNTASYDRTQGAVK